MDVKLMSNKISLNPGNFHDFVKKQLDKGETKTASVEVEKTAEEADEAETSGQPQAEAKLVNEPEKEKCQTGGADNSEAETSGQPQAEAKLVNHPKVETKDGSKVKKAEGDDGFGGKKAPPFGSEDDDKDDDKDEKKDDDKDDDKEDSKKCKECDCDPCECDKEEKEAKVLEFIKIAKLNPQNKDMLFTYWKQLYPEEYARAMVDEQ